MREQAFSFQAFGGVRRVRGLQFWGKVLDFESLRLFLSSSIIYIEYIY